ncbi:amidohydrolase [Hydrogenovibrio sp. 3SP14C1]|uniref:amidohydrolase family protein n=1 Tax=Hydrogenovibrio sp. 3SP14C1 TaxID=3038774 RepID=UPI002416ADB2|nr:amidohydrolase [Hydrogenovibrio sp. 3SP14C1]MDG4812714.1 amidohydrolase [Hydrogenovibrio sp. 3SP14C1]
MKKLQSIFLTLLIGLSLNSSAESMPIFDSHSHYSLADSQALSPKEIRQRYDRNHIIGALISSTPTSKTELLYQAMPNRIIPFLSLYRTKANKPNWMLDLTTLNTLETKLDHFPYQGVGEFHIFKQDVYSPVLTQVIKTAQKRNLMIMIHGDAEIVDQIFKLAPKTTVIWAHLGTQPTPEFLSQVFKRHPTHLYMDTSVRDTLFINETNQLKPEWRTFFIQHQDKLLAAVDTFSTQRWLKFDDAVSKIRLWLEQLPKPVAEKIAYQNALNLFHPSK